MKLATVAVHLPAPLPDIQVAEGLVILVQTAQPVLADQLLGLHKLARTHQAHHFVPLRRRNVNILESHRRLTAIQCIVVELNLLLQRTSENHRAQTAVAHRQGLIPVAGRRVIPKHHIAGFSLSHCRNEPQRAHQQQAAQFLFHPYFSIVCYLLPATVADPLHLPGFTNAKLAVIPNLF